jgi:hypothetical protein
VYRQAQKGKRPIGRLRLNWVEDGAPGEIRTPDLLIRSQILATLQDVALRCAIKKIASVYAGILVLLLCIGLHRIAPKFKLNSHQNSHHGRPIP